MQCCSVKMNYFYKKIQYVSAFTYHARMRCWPLVLFQRFYFVESSFVCLCTTNAAHSKMVSHTRWIILSLIIYYKQVNQMQTNSEWLIFNKPNQLFAWNIHLMVLSLIMLLQLFHHRCQKFLMSYNMKHFLSSFLMIKLCSISSYEVMAILENSKLVWKRYCSL